MRRFNVEVMVGLFLIGGFLCFAYLSVRLGDVDLFGSDRYELSARFGSISGLKEGATVELAGVKIGQVAGIRLDPLDYRAVVVLSIQRGVMLSDDSIASIRTAGIIGDRFVDLSPGGSEQLLGAGGEIRETESAVNLEELLSKYIFESQRP